LLKATVDARIDLDGKPAAGCAITFDGQLVRSDGRAAGVSRQNLTADEEGRVSTVLWPGTYRIVLQTAIDGEHLCVQTAETFRVRPGETVTRSFAITTATLRLRLLKPDGTTPAPGVQVSVRRPKPAWPRSAGTTDAAGCLRVERAGCGTVDLYAYPKPLTNPEGLRAFYKEGKQRLEDALVFLATVTVSPGGAEEVIVVPAKAGY
jgi:hypothetical protein